MQTCSHCNKQNKDDLRFCGHCGHKLNNTCPACNFKNLAFQEFCGNCGKQLSDKDTMSAMSHLQQQQAPPAAIPPSGPAEHAPTPAGKSSSTAVAINPELQLEEYALLSLEFTNFGKLGGASDNAQEIEQFKNQCVTFVEKTVLAENGWFKLIKDNIYFASFKNESSLDDSVYKAAEVSLNLLSQNFTMKDITLHLRIGLDIEQQGNTDSITATTERTVATPGDLVTSERAGRILGGRYKTKTVGPMLIGGEPRRFNRVIPPHQSNNSLAEDQPEPQKIDPMLKPVVTEADLLKMAKKKSAPQTEPTEVETPKAEPEPEAETETASAPEPVAPPPPEPKTTTPKPGGDYKSMGRVEHKPPEFGVRKATRLSNVTYRQTVDALAGEFSAHAKHMPNCKVITVSGSDGLGKSHIVQMARQQIDPEITWLGAIHYRVFAEQPIPLRTWLDLLENLLGFYPEGMPQQTVQASLERFLQLVYDGTPPALVSSCLQDLFNTPGLKPLNIESRGRLGRIESVLGDLLRQISAKKPVVLVLEDVFYADPASMALLGTLVENGLLENEVMLVLTHGRDFHLTGVLGEAIKKYPCKDFSVSDLSDTDMETFMNEGPLGGNLTSFPVALVDRMMGNAHGLPLQMEECMRALYLQDILAVDDETGKFAPNLDADLNNINLPIKLSDVLLQRIGVLSDHSRYVLQLASVIGERFPITLLMNLAQMPQEQFNEVLNNLFDHGFLIPDAVNCGRFRHGQIWQTVYTATDPSLRTQLHQLISQTLENDYRGGLTVNPALIAWHSERGELPNRGFTYWNMAGVHMAQVGALEALNLSLFKGLDLLQQIPADSEQRKRENMEHRARVYEHLGLFNIDGNPELAVSLFEWVLKFRTLNQDTPRMIEVLGFLASCYEKEGDYEQALATINKNLTLFSKTDYPLEYATLLTSKMEYLCTMGRLEEARLLHETEIDPLYSSQPLGEEPEHLNTCLNARLLRAQIMLASCDNRYFAVLEECLGFSRERGWEGLTIALELAQSKGFLRKGQYEACDRGADELLNRIEALADPDWFLAQWGLLAMMYHCELGDWDNAQQLVLTIVSKAEQVQDYQTWLFAQNYAGRVQLGSGNIAEAKRILEQSVETSSEFKMISCALHGWRWLAETEMAAGNYKAAGEILENAYKIATSADVENLYEKFMLTNTLARCLVDLGDDQNNISRAGKMLEAQWPIVVKAGFTPIVAHTAFAIGYLYKKMAVNGPSEASKKHLIRSVQFFQKAQGFWLEMGNKFQLNYVREVMPQV